MLKLVLYVFGISLASTSFASQQTVFGPKEFSPPLRGVGKPIVTFTSAKSLEGNIQIKNGNGEDLTPGVCMGNATAKLKCGLANLEKSMEASIARPANLEIQLNGKIILSKENYSPRIGLFTIPVNLLQQNRIEVFIKGLPTSSVTLTANANLVSPPTNQLPIPQIAVTPMQGFAPVTVSASAIGSVDPDGTIQEYNWTFGDGGTASGLFASHIYTIAGTYTVSLTAIDNLGGSSTKQQNVLVLSNQAPVSQLKITSDTNGLIPFMTSFDGSSSTDPEQQALKFDWDFGDGTTALNAGPQATHQYPNAGAFTITMKVTDTLGASSTAQVQVNATEPVLPPDPKLLAPPLIATEQPLFFESVRFLMSGPNPVQKNADLSQLDENRVSVIRGRITDDDKKPLGAVKVTVFNHPEFGETLSRSDGEFDLIVNGGGYLTVLYDRPGYLPVSRQVEVSYKDYFFAPDVVLSKLDEKVTKITLGAPVVQAIQSSVSSDESGNRTPTVLIPSGTAASLMLADGTLKSISSLSMRITEYTKGPNGPQRMPADLPAGVAYTHAFEVSADEAMAMGAKHIQFNKPVSYYVDNFLNVPVGYGIPFGILNPDTKLWEGRKDGVVLKILASQNNIASIDIDGEGVAATAAQLQAFNFTQEELSTLAALYPVGKSLWRVQTIHFSASDLNFLDADLANGAVSAGDAYAGNRVPVGTCYACGSVIDVHRLSLKEKIETAVFPFTLWYNSENAAVKEDDLTLRVPLTGPTIPNDLLSVEYSIEVAGKQIRGSVPPTPNQIVTLRWDGIDAYGRPYPYQVVAKAVVRQKYKRFYAMPNDPNELSWNGSIGNIVFSPDPQREGTYSTRTSMVKLGSNIFGEKYGLNGWTPSILHSFNPITKTIYFGDGTSREINETLRSVTSIAGSFSQSAPVEGGLATNNPIGNPVAVAAAIDGGIYYVDSDKAKVMRIDRDGRLWTVAGKSPGLNSGDGGPAIEATFASISKISVGPDGSLYIVDPNAGVVRKITPDGIINRVAGVGLAQGVTIADNVPATQFRFGIITGVVASKDGNVFISDGRTHVIYKISPDGILHRFAGTGVAGFSGDNGSAQNAMLSGPIVSDIGPNQEIYIADYYNAVIRAVEPSGLIHSVVGKTGITGIQSPDGTPAAEAKIGSPSDVKVAKNGNIVFLQAGTIRKVNSAGLLETLSYRGGQPIFEPGVGNALTSESMLLAQDGSILFADTGYRRIRRLGQVFLGNDLSLIQIPSAGGDEIYQFTETGRHLRTLFAKTGKTKWQFEYTAELLSGIIDADGRSIKIDRDSLGRAMSISNKFGKAVSLSTEADGWLSGIRLPSGDEYQFAYGRSGLLSLFKNPNGNSSTFVFDSKNNLVSDVNAQGAAKTLERRDLSDGYVSSITYPDGTKKLATSRQSILFGAFAETTERDGTKSSWTQELQGQNPAVFKRFEGGTSVSFSKSPDPRLGGAASFDISTRYALGWKNHTEAKEVFLDRYDPSNMFNFKQREVITPDSFLQPTKSVTYDSATQGWTLQSASGRYAAGKLDLQERPVLVQNGDLHPVLITYDTFGNVARVVQGDRITSFAYDSGGFLSAVTDPLGREHRFTNDLVGRQTQAMAPSGNTIDFLFDKNSNLTGIHPFGKDWHQFVYNIVDLFSVYQPPVVGSESASKSYVYNASQDLQKIVRADGKEVVYGYDPAKARLISVTMGTQKINYGYQDFAGNLTNVVNSENGINTQISYVGNRPSQISEIGIININLVQSYTNVDFVYDNYGNIKSISHVVSSGARSTIDYTYDVDNLMKTAGAMQINRSTSNSLVNSTALGSINDAYTYSNYGELAGYQSQVYSYTLQRDALGRIVQKNENTAEGATTYNYTYDADDRLNKVSKNGVVVTQYSYDGNGNRTSAAVNGQNKVSTFDSQDRIIQSGNVQYKYNAEGELIQKTDGTNITKMDYGLFGQLKSVQLPSGKVVSYDVNGLGMRVGRRVDSVYSGYYQWQSNLQLAAEVAPSGAVRSRFVYATQSHSPDYMIRDGVTYRFIKDQLGSIRFVVNTSDGSVAQQLDYDEWGVVLKDTNPAFQPFSFAGGLYDVDTGLVRFGARDYDPETGRWISKDPILFNGGDTNLYGYVANDPVNWADPSGLARCSYSISTGRLSCTSNDGSSTASANMFSGNNDPGSTGYKGGPIPMGKYDITKSPGANGRDWFLDPGLMSRIGYRLGQNRGGFNLHLRKGGSDGCITGARGENDNNFSNINNILNQDAGSNTIEVGF